MALTTNMALDQTRLPYRDRPSVEELATLSEEEAVRRRCDARNFIVLYRSFFVFLIAALIGLGRSKDTFAFVSAASSLAVAVVVLGVLRRIHPQKPPRRRPAFLEPLARRAVVSFRAFLLIAFAVESALVCLSSAHAAGSQGWLVVLPLIVMFLRLLTSEALLLHGFLMGLALAAPLVPVAEPSARSKGRSRELNAGEIIVPALAANAFALGIGLLVTRRFRRRVLEEWRGLREGAREQIRMREELEFARNVQLSMLPAAGPGLSWLDVAGRSVPTTEVGGDYFDYFPLGQDRLAIVSADVAGHGLACGLVLSGLRSCLALLSDELGEPADVARQLDLMVRRTKSHRMLVTLVVALFDRVRGTVTVTSAGHPPILRRPRGASRAEAIEFSSLPLGTNLSTRFEERRVALAPGDLFLLYTDGLYEAISENGEPYGLDRLTGLVGRLSPDLPAAAVCDAILEDLSFFAGRAASLDDVTVVAVRALPL